MSQEASRPRNPEHVERILGVDPGDERSAYVVLLDGQPVEHAWIANGELRELLREDYVGYGIMAIETLHPRGELASREAMETQLWAGRFIECVSRHSEQKRWIQVAEYDSRCALTGRTNATNAQVRQALLDRFGDWKVGPCIGCGASGKVPGKRNLKKCPTCKGSKLVKKPGPLNGMNEHERSALAAAFWYWQKMTDRLAQAS